jgi:hypothetical protein
MSKLKTNYEVGSGDYAGRRPGANRLRKARRGKQLGAGRWEGDQRAEHRFGHDGEPRAGVVRGISQSGSAVSIEVSGGGSGLGIAGLINGTAEIANSSRKTGARGG